MYLNIEEINSSCFDYEVRKKRLHFYLANSFYDTYYIGIEKENRYNILTLKEKFSLEEYKKLDKKIAHSFFVKKQKF